MEKVDKRFSELFLVPPGVETSPSTRSGQLERDNNLQRRPSIKKRILGVFQSSKNGREGLSEPPRTLKRRGKQTVERVVTVEVEVKQEMVEEIQASKTSTRSFMPTSCPPVSMDRYPRLRQLTLQDEIIPVSRPTPRSVPEPSLRTKSLTYYQTSTSNFISTPRNASPALTHRFSFQTKSRNCSPAPSTHSTRQFTSQANINRPRDHSPTPSTKSFASFRRRLSLRRNPPSEDKTTAGPVIIHPPHTMGNLGSIFSRKHTKTKSGASTGRDSKYSSVASLPGVTSLEEGSPRASAAPSPELPPLATLSISQFRQVESAIRRIERSLQHHQFHSDQLSSNLQYLCKTKWSNMDKLETYLYHRRANRSHIQQMRSSMSKARANVGTVFKKKATFSKRSIDALDDAKTELKRARDASDGEGYTLNCEVFRLFHAFFLVALEQYRNLDQEMKGALTAMRATPAFHMNKGDLKEIKAFACFVDGRLAKQELCYSKIEGLLTRVTSVED